MNILHLYIFPCYNGKLFNKWDEQIFLFWQTNFTFLVILFIDFYDYCIKRTNKYNLFKMSFNCICNVLCVYLCFLFHGKVCCSTMFYNLYRVLVHLFLPLIQFSLIVDYLFYYLRFIFIYKFYIKVQIYILQQPQ